jgi:hypothetical protein
MTFIYKNLNYFNQNRKIILYNYKTEIYMTLENKKVLT